MRVEALQNGVRGRSAILFWIAGILLLIVAAAYNRPPGPTFFRLMQERYENLRVANDGLQHTGVTLVGLAQGKLVPAGVADDPGLYVSVPHVAQLFHLSIATAYDLTCGILLVLAIVVGIAGFGSVGPKRLLFFMVAAILTIRAGDVYIFQALPGLAGLPWLFRFQRKRKLLHFGIISICMALAAAVCNLFRFGSAWPYIIIVVAMAISLYEGKRAALLVVGLLSVFSVPKLYVNHLLRQRNEFLIARGAEPGKAERHVFWHSVYVGLGWIPNSEVPIFLDEVGFAKARSIDPQATLTSDRYERIIRAEVFRIVQHKPWIVAVNVLVKLALILLMAGALLLPAAKSFGRRPWELWFDGAFLVAIIIGLAPGILVVPQWRYMLTGLCGACLYADFSCMLASNQSDSTAQHVCKGGKTLIASQDKYNTEQNQPDSSGLREANVFSKD